MLKLNAALEHGARIGTIVAAIVAALTLGSGYFIFRHSTTLQREVTAIALFREYLSVQAELAERFPNLAPDEAPCSRGAMAYSETTIWKCAYGLFVGESILNLRGSDPGWRKTVENIVWDHAWFIDTDGLRCREYSADFLSLVSEVVDGFQCTPS